MIYGVCIRFVRPNGAIRVANRVYRSVLAVALANAACASAAADICVSCSAPSAAYSCQIDGLPSQSDDARIKLYCIAALAKSGGHATCAVSRTSIGPCDGQAKVLPAPDGLSLGSDATPITPALAVPGQPTSEGVPKTSNTGVTTVDKNAATPQLGKPQSGKPDPIKPATIEDAVKTGAASAEKTLDETGDAVGSAAQSAGSALKSAGKAVGDAATKSWNCVVSMFGDC